MAETQSPTTIESVLNTGTIECDDSDNEPLVSVAERRRKHNRVKKFAGTMAVASIAALALVGSAGSESSAGSVESDLTGPQVQLVCVYPKDVPSCEIDRVLEAGEGMQAFLRHPDHGTPGFSMRISMVDGKMTVKPVQLDKNTSEVVDMTRNIRDDGIARHNLITYFEDQIYAKAGDDPFTVYASFLSGTSPLGKEGYACTLATHWNGIAAGRRVLVEALTSTCDPGNPYHGFRAPHQMMLADIAHNDGYVPREYAPEFIDSPEDQLGYSRAPRNFLNPVYIFGGSWWETNLGNTFFRPGDSGGGRNLAEEPRFAWQVNAADNGRGEIKLFSDPDGDGELTPIKLDPGNRLPAGTLAEARFMPVPGERLKSWSGDGEGTTVRKFTVNEVINLQANVEQLPQASTYEVTVEAKGFSAIGLGKKCIEFCKVNKKQGSTFEIRAEDLPKKPVMKILGWLGCDKVINRKNIGKVCQVKNLSRNRKLTAKTAPAR